MSRWSVRGIARGRIKCGAIVRQGRQGKVKLEGACCVVCSAEDRGRIGRGWLLGQRDGFGGWLRQEWLIADPTRNANRKDTCTSVVFY